MNITNAILIAEGEIEVDEDTYIKNWQFLIDEGICWQLQGWFGRMADQLIEDGLCVYSSQGED